MLVRQWQSLEDICEVFINCPFDIDGTYQILEVEKNIKLKNV